MGQTMRQLLSLRNCYVCNGMLYYLQRFHLTSQQSYASGRIKSVFLVLAAIYEIGKTLFTKGLYAIAVVAIAGQVMRFTGGSEALTFPTILFFLTLAGGWSNCYVLEPKKEQYYAIVHMRMPARSVVLASYGYFLLTMLAGSLPFYLLYGLFLELSWVTLLLLFLCLAAAKLCGGALKMALYDRRKNLNVIKMSVQEVAISLVLAAIGPVLCYFDLPLRLPTLFCLTLLLLALSLFCLRYMLRYPRFTPIYKFLLAQWNDMTDKKTQQTVQGQKLMELRQESTVSGKSSKQGYAFLNDTFMKRHRKILSKTSQITLLVEVLLVLALLLSCVFLPDIRPTVNEAVPSLLPIFLYFMCFLNRGESVVRFFYMNCDHELLHYRFYRQPRAILEMFRHRLQSIIGLDLLQSIGIALGLPLLLFASGGTDDPLQYVLLPVTIVAMSVFFSVHNLVIYYTLQPFNKEMQAKNPAYLVVKFVTYIGCFLLMRSDLPLLLFGVAVSAFCLLYVIISIPIAYRVAPKTFRLR